MGVGSGRRKWGFGRWALGIMFWVAEAGRCAFRVGLMAFAIPMAFLEA